MPARFRFTAESTSESHDSPAPAARITSSPCCVVFTPPIAICSTRPLKPSSEMTRLLPPPSTNTDPPCHSATAARWSTCVARANQRAGPPIPNVVNGASGTCSCRRSTCTERLFLFSQGGDRFDASTQRELDPVAGCKLTREREIRSNDRGDVRIAHGCLSIGHQQDWIARRRNLDAAGKGGVGNHRAAVKRLISRIANRRWRPGPFGPGDKAIAHSIGLRGNREARAYEPFKSGFLEVVVLRTTHGAETSAVNHAITNHPWRKP